MVEGLGVQGLGLRVLGFGLFLWASGFGIAGCVIP